MKTKTQILEDKLRPMVRKILKEESTDNKSLQKDAEKQKSEIYRNIRQAKTIVISAKEQIKKLSTEHKTQYAAQNAIKDLDKLEEITKLLNFMMSDAEYMYRIAY